jgi:hypothetical protein
MIVRYFVDFDLAGGNIQQESASLDSGSVTAENARAHLHRNADWISSNPGSKFESFVPVV